MTTKNVNKDPVSQNKKKTVNKEGLYEMTLGKGMAAKFDVLSSIPCTQRGNQLPQVFLWIPYMYHSKYNMSSTYKLTNT